MKHADMKHTDMKIICFADTPEEFREVFAAELDRQIAAHLAESYRYTGVKASAVHAAKISKIADIRKFLLEIKIFSNDSI